MPNQINRRHECFKTVSLVYLLCNVSFKQSHKHTRPFPQLVLPLQEQAEGKMYKIRYDSIVDFLTELRTDQAKLEEQLELIDARMQMSGKARDLKVNMRMN